MIAMYLLFMAVVTNIILHGFGLYLLIASHVGTNRTVQHIYITNLSASELVKNSSYLIFLALKIAHDSCFVYVKKFHLDYFERIFTTCGWALYYLAM